MSGADMNAIVGHRHLLLMTLDTLRYDVAAAALAEGRTPNLARVLPEGWERRHTPGSFTYAAHAAFFAGFLPTPVAPGPHPRPFALAFAGSETIDERTCVLDGPDLVDGLRRRGYRSTCVGGVGFFNLQTPLGRVLPALFDQAHWTPAMGVTDPHSFEHQLDRVEQVLGDAPVDQLQLLFLNVSALHQPNCLFSPGATTDSTRTQADALAYVDRHLPRLWRTLTAQGPWHVIICSDHGTAYGEDGHTGHRLAHDVVWTVPYAQFDLPGERSWS
jgi:hypothetical protein